ncbi:RAD55 family ATPase [Halomicroarcula sp. GCM10025817]|uniref:RAD55 family ATPase n=1 Tax=Haloarcula TaxID=2237 RepID=UPI0023E78928|nr:transcriptional regulator [Halomicroarcula sp. SYNS111]
MRLSTGIDTIDRTLGGGLQPGSVVALLAPPEAQSLPLLCAHVGLRPTHYVTTLRTPDSVRRQLDQQDLDPKLRRIEHVDLDDALATIEAGLEDLEDGDDLVVDVMDPLERTAEMAAYLDLLTALSRRLTETGGVGMLHCLESGREADSPNRELTLSMADHVWRLESRRDGRRSLSYYLEIPKATGIALRDDQRVQELEVGSSVHVDRTRDD